MKANKIKKAYEIPAQEQLKITFDYGVLESSRFFITTDKTFYEKMIKSFNAIPVFTLELLDELNTKEIHQNVLDLQFYVFRILLDK